jgi:uncharacterized repeat protein (TIGR03806 family)
MTVIVPSEFGLDTRPQNMSCVAPDRPPPASPVVFQQVFSNVNLDAPMMMAQIPGDSSRWFVAQRSGTIVSFPVASPPSTPTTVANLASLAGQPVNQNGEGGLLGFAFHPQFSQANNGKLFVSWTTNRTGGGMRSVVGVLKSTNQGASFTTYSPILGFDQPNADNHKGGAIAFGKDGLLYLGFGDGGNSDDYFKNGQKKTGFFAKVLRINVDTEPYSIPDGNPFKNGGGEPATFAYGFRNPFRFSIDRDTNELWVGDVGQDHYEEVDRVVAGGNYGWPCREGLHDYITNDTSKCPSSSGLTDPLVEHEHVPANSRAIVGGVVYRGRAISGFSGTYVYGDNVAQQVFLLTFDPATGAPKTTQLTSAPAEPWAQFAEDNDGEIYAVSLSGSVYELVAAQPAAPSTFPDRLSKTGCVERTDPKLPAAGVIAYGVNAQLWSDGADKARYFAIPDGTTISVRADGDFDLPIGSVAMKTFFLGGKRIETRLLVRHSDGGWAGYTYEWLDDESDAVLLPSSKTKTVGAQTWYYPSGTDCVRCHTDAAGRTLGLELGQLNGDFVYPSTNRQSNQLKTLDHIGLFSQPLSAPVDQLTHYPNPNGSAALESRARAYLHANCSHCHRPNGGGRGNMDLRFATPFSMTNTCNANPEAGDLGVVNAKLLVPGSANQSLISLRPHATGSGRMPPLASSVVDTNGLAVVDDWIRSLTTCP